MKISDSVAIKILQRANSDVIQGYLDVFPNGVLDPDQEIRLAISIIAELAHRYSAYGDVLCDNLKLSRKILRETDYGRKPDTQYSAQDIADAKATVNEYNRIKRLTKEYY